MKNFRFIVPASLNYSESVRMVAMEIGEDAGFEKREKNMIRLVIDELYMNAVKYGSDENSTVLVEGGFEGDTVFFAVEDEGKGKNKTEAEDLLKIIQEEKDNTNLQKTHGRGLAQITGVMTSSFEVKNGKLGGIRIEFSKKKGEKSPESLIKRDKKDKKAILKKVDERVFELKGVIDLQNIEEVVEPIDEYVKHISFPVELDLECKDLKFFNSTFIGKIAGWHTAVSENGGELKMKNVCDDVFEILDLVGLTQLITIET